jgi:hypothetical protein
MIPADQLSSPCRWRSDSSSAGLLLDFLEVMTPGGQSNDGEAVVLGVDGISDFNALHSGKHNDEVQLYAFDILALSRPCRSGR